MAHHLLPKILKTFIFSLLFALIGFIAGNFVPDIWILPIIILEFLILITVLLFRKAKKVSYGLLFSFTFITGITTNPIIMHYVNNVGIHIVVMAILTTIIIFTGLSIYSWKSKKDFTFLGGFLFAALLGLIAIGALNIFFPLNSTALLVYSTIGVIIFSGYILYDISTIKYQTITEEDIPLITLNLYLDFVNILLDLLRLFGIISKND